METIEMLINELDSEVLQAKNAPFSKTDIVLNKDKMLEIIARLRRSYPTALKEAYEIVEQKDKYLSDAEAYANSIMDDAEKQHQQMLEENAITLQAKSYAEQIKKEAIDFYDKTDYDARVSSFNLLDDIENLLSNTLQIINENKQKLIK